MQWARLSLEINSFSSGRDFEYRVSKGDRKDLIGRGQAERCKVACPHNSRLYCLHAAFYSLAPSVFMSLLFAQVLAAIWIVAECWHIHGRPVQSCDFSDWQTHVESVKQGDTR